MSDIEHCLEQQYHHFAFSKCDERSTQESKHFRYFNVSCF